MEKYMIIPVDENNITEAARIHSLSWKESHRSFCDPAFIELHSIAHQEEYIRNKMKEGSSFFMLIEDGPVGIVSVTDSLIEDLYILPEMQNRGYGTRLLEFAMGKCREVPTLWILENNKDAERLYLRMGFYKTGRRNAITIKLDEIEYKLHKRTDYTNCKD